MKSILLPTSIFSLITFCHLFIDVDLVKTAEAETYKKVALSIAPIHNISREEVLALLSMESPHDGMAAYRFEKRQFEKQRKKVRNPNQARMLASSHCAFQVMGYTAKTYHVHWNELYDETTCAEVGLAYYAKQKEACKKQGLKGLQIIKCGARRYNGSGKKAQRYSRKFIMHYKSHMKNQ